MIATNRASTHPSEYALLVLKPDAVLQGLAPAIGQFVADHGFVVRRSRSLHVGAGRREQLYATTRHLGHLDWDLTGILYSFAPVEALLLEARAAPGGSASRALSRLKGDFVPTRAEPGTIRRSFPALNPVCNLVHSSDDEQELAREVQVLFGAPLEEVLRPSATVRLAVPARRGVSREETLARALSALGVDPPRLVPRGQTAADFAAIASTLRRISAEQSRGDVSGIVARVGAFGRPFREAVSFDAFYGAVCRGGLADRWEAYVAYTTIAHLDICLEEER